VNKTDPDWFAKYTMPFGEVREGVDGIHPYVISFHYMKGDLMDRAYALFYGLCNETRPSSVGTSGIPPP
jgi:hypothetical protein